MCRPCSIHAMPCSDLLPHAASHVSPSPGEPSEAWQLDVHGGCVSPLGLALSWQLTCVGADHHFAPPLSASSVLPADAHSARASTPLSGRGLLTGWDIDPEDVEILRTSDGEPWLLGEGSFGKVGGAIVSQGLSGGSLASDLLTNRCDGRLWLLDIMTAQCCAHPWHCVDPLEVADQAGQW